MLLLLVVGIFVKDMEHESIKEHGDGAAADVVSDENLCYDRDIVTGRAKH